MVRIFYREGLELKKETSLEEIGIRKDMIWVDLQNATEGEKTWIEKKFGLQMQDQKEVSEIESSSRYREKNGAIIANSNFLKLNLQKDDEGYPVAFQLKNNILFSFRIGNSETFAETVRKMKVSEKTFLSGADILLWLFETQIDYKADLLESISRNITEVYQNLMSERAIDTDGILKIIRLQEETLTLGYGISDKKKVLASILNSHLFPEDRKPRLENILEDISSLLEFIPLEMERMGNLQQTQKNLSLQEQKKIIHVSMVYATGILLAILIADIFSMNLPNIPIPGLASSFGFWLCIGLISLSSIGIAIHLRNKKWT